MPYLCLLAACDDAKRVVQDTAAGARRAEVNARCG